MVVGEKNDLVMLFIFSSRNLRSCAFVGLRKESIIKSSTDVSSAVLLLLIFVESAVRDRGTAQKRPIKTAHTPKNCPN